MVSAALAAIIFQRLRQPVILGYILAGILLGPGSFFPSPLHELGNINALAELGVLFLMFYIGLEFNPERLKAVFAPALLALSLLAAPPVLLATVAGFRGVDSDLKRAARGMGMSPMQLLRRVETPLAAPVVASGVRIASVEVIASATLAAFIGAGGLGDFITLGFQLNRPAIMLVGAVPVALLALGSELSFGLLDRWLRRWSA